MSVLLQRKPVPLPAWHLTDQSAMLTALGELSAEGWRGTITCNPVDSTWRIELNADDPVRQVIAAAGDWLVEDFGLRKLTAEEFDDNYEVVE